MFIKKNIQNSQIRKTLLDQEFQKNPIGYIKQPIINHGILECPMYNAYKIPNKYCKPKFLSASEGSNVLYIVGSPNDPLSIAFPDGLYNSKLKNFIKKLKHIKYLVLNESSYVYAEIYSYNDNNLKFGSIPITTNLVYSQTEPITKNRYDHWFDIQNNQMKYWDWNDEIEQYTWFDKIYVFLGRVGVGTDNIIYAIESWCPNKFLSDYWETNFDVTLNPFAHYDVVSYIRNIQYIINNIANWVDDDVTCQIISKNQKVCYSLSNNSTAVNIINSSSVASQYFNF